MCGVARYVSRKPAQYYITLLVRKDVYVVVNMDYSSGSLQWNVGFIHLAHDWEMMSLLLFPLVLI